MPVRMRPWIAIIVLVCSVACPMVSAQEADSLRRISDKVTPVYPELARNLNLKGIVKLRVTVMPDGAVKQSEVLGGNPLLAKAAQDAVKKWKWAPAAQETKEVVELNFHPK